MVNLAERAMLVTLSRSQWGGERTDRKVSKELTIVKDATERSARVVKKLLPVEALQPVQRATGEARVCHYSYTLPWRDNGARVLRSAIYEEYIKEMRARKEACDRADRVFFRDYEIWKHNGMIELGAMVREEDYPTLEQIKSMFSFTLDVTPIPTGGDFRVDVPDAGAIRSAIDRDTWDAVHAGLKSKLVEATDVIRHMKDKLESYQPGSEGVRATGTFRDSLVENVRDLARMLPKLNVMEYAEIDDLAAKIQANLGRHDADALREDGALRAEVSDSASDILDLLSEHTK